MEKEEELQEFWPGENALGFTEEEDALRLEAETWEGRQQVTRIRDERRARLRRERDSKEWSASEAGRLLDEFGKAYEAYYNCLAQDPELPGQALEFDEKNQKIFNRMKTNMEKAQNAPRCRYVKPNGLGCRAPRVRGRKFCHMHLMLEEARPQKISLPSLGDANSIQAAIAKGAQAVVDGKLEQKQASILGYYLQLALSNVGKMDFEDEWREMSGE
jgi:hypothetical protein